MCTFITNDLDDIEKDKVNHPDRPLPSGNLAPTFVAVFYYFCLAMALFTTRHFVVATHVAFLYYLLLILCISYHYIVEYLPTIKAIYVAAASSVPLLILVAHYPNETALYWIAVALFAVMLGREMCKDLLDRAGDPVSFLHRIPEAVMATLAFALQALGLALLTPLVNDLKHFIGLVTMTALLALSGFLWFHLQRRVAATGLMKLVIFLGLYFLL
jgi:geranylgeranylglycerol-phosphate geranylgeranyltransferase